MRSVSVCLLLMVMVLAPTVILCQGDECTMDKIRLASGRTEFEGRVEICVEGSWGTVCDDGWRVNDALVVCRQLGFNLTNIAYPASFGAGVGPIHLDEVECTGTEERLLNCTHTRNHDCEHHEDAGVICPSDLCENGTVRLVDGHTKFEGRIEVCFDGVWGSVCPEDWEQNRAAATVICKQLGIYSSLGLGAMAFLGRSGGLGPIFVIDITCTGEEERLVGCEYEFTGTTRHFCSRISPQDSMDASVRCIQVCSDEAVRLIGQTGQSSQGRLEVCFNNTWGTVCSEGWDSRDSVVACKQLGFSGDYGVRSTSFPAPAESDHTFCFSRIECTGDEESIVKCPFSQVSDEVSQTCDHSMYIGIACSRSPCLDGDVRLIGGPNNQEGRVQACTGGVWLSVCGDNWTEAEATTVCGQLGYTEGGAFPTQYVSGGGENVLLSSCLGNEPTLANCSNGTTNQCRFLAGVFCSAPCFSSGHSECSSCVNRYDCYVESSLPQCYCNAHCFSDGQCCPDVLYTEGCIVGDGCVNGEVRLYGGISPQNGLLEMCIGGHWARVCANQPLDLTIAALVCSQLGYTSTLSSVVVFPAGSFFLFQDFSAVSVHGLSCIGSELIVTDCYYQRIGNGSCLSGSTSLVCSEECVADSIRLEDGSSKLDGRVEVCRSGVWASLYAQGWNDLSARVLCKQLGYDGDAAALTVPERSGLRVCSRVSCTGSEERLLNCARFVEDLSPSCMLAGAKCSSSSQKSIVSLSILLLVIIGLLVVCD